MGVAQAVMPKQVGKQFRLVKRGNYHAVFECQCGTRFITSCADVRRMNTKSCGCFQTAHMKNRMTTHGMTKTKVYSVWKSMIRRTNEAFVNQFPNYSGRGIKTCDRWKSFTAFVEDMGLPQDGLTLERVDVNGDYCPENCTWADYQTQSDNRRVNVYIRVGNEIKTLAAWGREFGCKSDTFMRMVEDGRVKGVRVPYEEAR